MMDVSKRFRLSSFGTQAEKYFVFAAEKKGLTIRSMRRSSSGLEDTSGVRTPSMGIR